MRPAYVTGEPACVKTRLITLKNKTKTSQIRNKTHHHLNLSIMSFTPTGKNKNIHTNLREDRKV
jgi:hypothetical protein